MQAARRQFAEGGYARTSLRAVALEAGVDPALVVHYFGGKVALFEAAVQLPFEPAQVLPVLLAQGPDGLGERLVRFVLGVLESEQGRTRMVGLVRAAATEPEAAAAIRSLLTRELLTPLAQQLGVGGAELRSGLVASQLVGLTMARHVVGIEPLALATVDQLAAALGPTLQRYLTGELFDGGS